MIDLSYIIPDNKARNMKADTDNKTEERRNRFNGESIMLTKEEAIKHDRIFINGSRSDIPLNTSGDHSLMNEHLGTIEMDKLKEKLSR